MPDLTFDRFKAIVADQLGVEETEQATPEASIRGGSERERSTWSS